MSLTKTKHLLCAIFLAFIAVPCSQANSITNNLVNEIANEIKEVSNESNYARPTDSIFFSLPQNIFYTPLYVTIIEGADEEVTCSNDQVTTLSKFFLCGTSDVRTLSLSISGASYEWQKLDPNSSGCVPTVTPDCPTFNSNCAWNTVGTNTTYDLDSDGEYRVRVDSGAFYYFKSSLNPLNPQIIKEDIICGNPGRVEITNVPSGYEYSLNNSAGPYQDTPYFDVTSAGDYMVWVRLKNVSATACLFPSNTVTISSSDIRAEVVAHDILCSGQFGSIDVQIFDVPGFYTYRLIKNGITVDTFGPNASDTYTFANVSSGDYSIRVETNDCSELITLDDNNNPIAIGGGISPIAVSATASDSFGCGATSVSVDILTSGGTGPYRFSVDGGAFSATYASTASFTVATSGTYNILVEDANGCIGNAAVDVEDIPEPTFTVTPTDGNCGGASEGSITITVANTNGYSLSYSNDNGATFQVSNVFSSLASGTYDIVVRYEQGSFSCNTNSVSSTINPISTIVGSATADITPTCGNENGGQITISGASGGAGGYEYSIGAGFSSNPVFSSLGVGTYTPRIRDANGCVEPLAPIVFSSFNKPTDLDFVISNINCATGTVTVTLTVTDGTGPYNYEIIAPGASAVNNGASNVFNGLALGTYTFRVTDSVGCSYDENFAITDISSISAQAQATRGVTCVGDSDGEGRFLVDGFNVTYSYSIDGGAVTTGQTAGIIPLTSMAAGSYVISVTDEDTNCTDTATLIIEEPTTAFAISSTTVVPMDCQNGNVGGVTLNTTGGWGGNRYTLTQPDATTIGPTSSNSFSNLSQSGTYNISVNDANGCSLSSSFSLTPLTAPVITIDPTTDYCFDNVNAASIVVTATLGVGTYEYRINNGPWGTSNSFLNLTPNTYNIEVRDVNNCRDNVLVTIAEEITAIPSIIRELECGVLDGQIRVNINHGYTSGGNYDYYEVSVNGGAYSGSTNITGNSFTYSIPNDGSITVDTNFQFQVYDFRGCPIETNIITISPPETILGTATGQDTVCGDATSGVVVVNADTSQGIPPYEYSNDGGVTYSTQNVFSGYGPGTYNDFMVRDSRMCTSVLLSATIGTSVAIDATVVDVDAVCTGGTVFGSINVTAVANGVANYTYELLDINGISVATIGPTASTTQSFANVIPGTYTVVTTDATGCEDRDVVTITQNELDLNPVATTTPPDCNTTFTYIVDIVGGSGSYTIGLVGNTLVPPNVDSDTHDFTGEIVYGVTYFVEVLDSNGCRYIEQIDPIIPPSPITIAATSTTASCNALGSGEIYYTVDGITPSPADFTVLLVDTDTGSTIGAPIVLTNELVPYNGIFTGLSVGNYQILVQDNTTSCNASVLTTITEDIPSVVIDDNIPATCNVGALVTVRANGGTAPYRFAYVSTGNAAPATGVYTSDTTFEIGGTYPSDYDFYVEDASGCVSFSTVTITEGPGVPTPTVNVINQCSAQSNYTVNITSPLTIASGLPEDTFQYDIGGGFQDSPNFVVPNPGDYTIIVRDGNGCFNTVIARVFDYFSITASATSEPTCNAGDGVITVNTSGGSGNFSYQLRDGGTLIDIGPAQSTNTFIGLFPSNYNIVVTDLDSNTLPLCSDDTNVNVSLVVPPVISSTPHNDVTCHGANDGNIIVELQTGTDVDGPFNYTLYDGAGTTVEQGPQATPLFVGLSGGTYQVEVVSERGCPFRSGDIIIINPPDFLINTTNTNFSCDPNNNKFNTSLITVFTDSNGDGSGTATGTPSYTYSMDDGTTAFDGTSFQTSNVFEVVDNGTNRNIVITARDQNGCEVVDTFTINAPTDLTFSFNVGAITCDASGSGVTPGILEIIINEGAGNYEVEILPLGSEAPRSSGGTDRVTWDISTPGDYIFAVRDLGLGGCNYLTPIVNVPDYNTIDAVIAENKPVTCFNGNDGELNITVNNYSGIYTYEVFSRDNAGVETTTGVTGSFDTNTPINSPEIIAGLPAGNMVVRIEAQDTPFCDTVSNVATVRSPDRALTVSLLPTAEVTCAVPGLGEITATGDGGWGAYEYQLIAPDGTTILQDFPNINNIFTGLSSGIHTVNIRDALGCVESNTIELLPPVAIYADIQVVTPLQCNNDNDAIIEAYNISGGQGTGNYLFQLIRLSDGTTSGLQTTPVFANLSAGDYQIIVLDGWNCSFTTNPITVQDPEVVVAELRELQPPGCGDNGIMQLNITNPELGIDYAFRRAGTTDPFVSLGIGVTSIQISVDISIDPGPFVYDVQNSNGCPFEKSNQISLDAATPLVISLDLTNATINCAGEATGIIRSEAYGGIGNYTYTLLNSNTPSTPVASNTLRPAQSSGIFRELDAGTYYVFARSGACEVISTPIVIDPKPPLVLEYVNVEPVSCNGEMNGVITIEASGGTGNIRYAISENLSEFFEGDDPAFPNRKSFTDLEPKVYEVIIQDDLGCTITQTLEITEPTMLVGGLVNATPETCLGDNDGSITLEVQGGTAPYFTSINSNDDADFVQNDTMFIDNLNGGETYVIFIRDSRGCEANVIVPVGIGVDLEAEPIVQYGCDGIFPNNTTTIEMMDETVISSLLFSLDVDDVLLATPDKTFGDLIPGEHTVYIYHENGCYSSVDFSIDSYEPLTLEASKTGPNEITAIAAGGYGGYEYYFQGETTGENNVYTVNMDANLTITAIDQMGCVATLKMPFLFTGMLDLPNYFTPDGDLLNDEWYPKNRDMFATIDVKIYDRYGRVVAILNEVTKWDGTYEGSDLPTGDYWYVVNANNSEAYQYVGHFTLYR